jgi:hypothetical protein
MGPAFGPSNLTRDSISSIEFAQVSFSRFQWVMNWDAFQASTKSGGVCFRQLRTASSEGVR